MKQTFNVSGMTCSACSAHVEKAVCRLEGVAEVNVSLLTNSMQVTYDEDAASSEAIIAAVKSSGYGASLPRAAETAAPAVRQEDVMAGELAQMKHRMVWSFVFLIPLFYISMGHMMGAPLPGFLTGMDNALAFAFTQLLLTLPIMYLNDKYYKVGFKTLLRGAPNMDSLIAVGSMAAVAYGVFAIYQIGFGLGHGDGELVAKYHMDLYFESAGMILTLITLGKFLETRSKGKTSQAITRLMDLAPKTARVLREGGEMEIPVEEVRVGDRIVVRPGQAIPVDGTVTEGASAVDESALTGESLPVDKGPGDKVAAASINKSGSFVFEATRVGQDTTLAGGGGVQLQGPHRQAGGQGGRGVCARGHGHRRGDGRCLAGRHPQPGAGPHRRSGGAGDLLPLRPGSGHAGGHHGGHRQGGGKRHSGQVRRGPGDPPRHRHGGAG